MSPESLEQHSELKTEISRVFSASSFANKGSVACTSTVFWLATSKRAFPQSRTCCSCPKQQCVLTRFSKLTPVKGRPEISKEIEGLSIGSSKSSASARSEKTKSCSARPTTGRESANIGWSMCWAISWISRSLVPGKTQYDGVTPAEGWLASPTFGKEFRLECRPRRRRFLNTPCTWVSHLSSLPSPTRHDESLHHPHRPGRRHGPGQCRHRPDHPQAVPQTDRADRLRRVPVLRLAAAATTVRRTRSSN